MMEVGEEATYIPRRRIRLVFFFSALYDTVTFGHLPILSVELRSFAYFSRIGFVFSWAKALGNSG